MFSFRYSESSRVEEKVCINHSCEGLVEHNFSELNVNFYVLGLERSLAIETAVEEKVCINSCGGRVKYYLLND